MTAPPGWTTVPADDGSSGWVPYHPTPSPAPAQPAPPPPPAAAPTTTPQVVTTTARPAPHKAVHHPRRPQPAERVLIVPVKPTSAVLGTTATTSRSADPSLVLVVALCLAIACFACGAAPADHIRWRRGAFLLASRRTAVTMAGGVFLLAAAILLATR